MAAKSRRPTMGANPAYIRADLDRRRSNAGGHHDSRPNRQRSRQAARRAAVRDQY